MTGVLSGLTPVRCAHIAAAIRSFPVMGLSLPHQLPGFNFLYHSHGPLSIKKICLLFLQYKNAHKRFQTS